MLAGDSLVILLAAGCAQTAARLGAQRLVAVNQRRYRELAVLHHLFWIYQSLWSAQHAGLER